MRDEKIKEFFKTAKIIVTELEELTIKVISLIGWLIILYQIIK